MTRAYISGPITGKPNLNREAFYAAAMSLRAQGLEVVNPFEVCPNPASWLDAMRADIKALVDCDRCYMLPGWQQSKGACIEAGIAHGLGLEMIYLEAV